MTPDDTLKLLDLIEVSPGHGVATLRQEDVLIRYAQPGSHAADLIRRDAELLLALSPHGLPGPTLLELDLSGRRLPHAFSCQRLPHPKAVRARDDEDPAVWRQLGSHLRRLHALPVLASGVVVPSPDPRGLLEELNETQVITDSDLRWLDRWVRHLQAEAGPAQPATLHGSLRPANVLLSPDRSTVLGLLDWSHAQAGDAARDHVHLPLSTFEALSGTDARQTAALLLAYVTRLFLELRDAAQGRAGLAAATARLLALFQLNVGGDRGSRRLR